jgi:3-deoxy-D-manno-octulosonic acid kinase
VKAPEGFVEVTGLGAHGFARPAAREWVQAALTRWGSLARAAEHAPHALELRGRGVVHAVTGPDGGRWVVRRYHRGGMVAPVLGQRYLRRGQARPLREALASEAARARGIPSPEVLAGIVYAAGVFYRADLVTRYVPDSQDLAALLFGGGGKDDADEAEPPLRAEALRGAGELVVRLARAGIRHPDLNAKNFLVTPGDGPRPTLTVLDLDRALVEAPGSVDPGRMGARLERSLRKLERASNRYLGEVEWRALAQGLDAGGGDP